MDLVAHAGVVIRAPRSAVWRALLAPESIPRILPVTEVVEPWRLGRRFVWTFQLAEVEARVEGRVQRVEVEQLLEYDYVDPHSLHVLRKSNVHGVLIELSDHELGTQVTVTQDANLSAAAHAHAEGGWRLALANLKELVERAPRE
ncbi:MAG TPA: SRPBCC domain-containing protein [Polyangiaceae bacterium]|nr:SRPBCC domain-containing protein [Polyangiaceae bacterium]